MKILILSYVFSPSIGGIETISRLIAQQLAEFGHQVTVVTQTKEDAGQTQPQSSFQLVRSPSFSKLCRLYCCHDVILSQNISLRLGWPLLLINRPCLMIMHGHWLTETCSRFSAHYLKKLFSRRCRVVAISQEMANRSGGSTPVIHNCYDNAVFRINPETLREREIIFVGRLVSDKGVDVLVRALAVLKEAGVLAKTTIVGGGPDKLKLQQLVKESELERLISFRGSLAAEEVANELNLHKIIVVPSVWDEPFGIVALEGLACGCVAVVTNSGGLPDAVGMAGLKFAKGDHLDLAENLVTLLNDDELFSELLDRSTEHLKNFCPAVVARKYEALLSELLRQRNSKLGCK